MGERENGGEWGNEDTHAESFPLPLSPSPFLPFTNTRLERMASRTFCIVTAIFGLLLIGGGPPDARAQAAPDSLWHVLQIRASEDSVVIEQMLDSLRQMHVPAYRLRAEVDGDSYHRLRVGPFTTEAAARRVARFHAFDEAWIVDVPADSFASQAPVTHVLIDTLSVRGTRTYVYPGEHLPVVAVLQRAGGPRNTLPAPLRLYRAGRERPLRIDNVTGLLETDSTLEFGQAERVYVAPERKTERRLRAEVQAFSELHGLSRYIVQDGLALYNNGRIARFTVLGVYSARRDAVQVYPQPGFDFAGFGGVLRRFTGPVQVEARYRRGNAHAHRLPGDRPFALRSDRVVLYSRPLGERGAAVVFCALFFAEREA